MTGALIVAAWFAVLVLLACAFGRPRPAKIHTPRRSLWQGPPQIVCGDCCGDRLTPRKTYMTRSGECDECGGRSFVLASERAARRPVPWQHAEPVVLHFPASLEPDDDRPAVN